MKASSTLFAIFIVVISTAGAQVVPSIEGPYYRLPISGTLHYDLRYTQTADFYEGYTEQIGTASGELAYANTSAVHPLALVYSGGDSWAISGPPNETGVFQHMLVSDGLVRRDWSLKLMDEASYTPQAPVTGFSGIPGVGTLPGQPGFPTQPILTQNLRSVGNTVGPDFTHTIGHATSLVFGGRYSILRFPDGIGLATDSVQANGQINRRLDALNSIFGQYVYGYFSYPAYPQLTMDTQSALFGYLRTWTRQFKTSVSAGPEWIQSSNNPLVPPSTSLTANASATYALRTSTTATVSYLRGVTGGAGEATEVAIHNNDVTGAITQLFGRKWTITATGSYMRTQGFALQLDQTVATNAELGGVSATRRFGRYFTAFANYTAIQQSSNLGLGANVVNGLSQVVGFGVAYSPRDINLKK
jgi:hypothetical protein